ncbi:hypothetical protein DNL40_08865 [Xylanimonas oleitrophica]|uniref:YncI copper-binding domain-containing protein n=1 Tax=Xylanimonas oleitrophica TaxID=2607479 RepID=A0A2W5WXS2_9MICO|nr:YcnI family protein [Xylanimonas oleitrophica]PZR53106.1 hypothetical protein DNL40_08865 [Xylanimonas oleitrophica]
MSTTSARAPRALTTAGATLLGLSAAVLLAGPAAAHVRVDPGGDGTATAGGYAVLTFRVPNESETASTTQVRVDLPTDTPFTSVSVEPVPGWTATVERAPLPEPVQVHGATVTEAPSAITWTADDDAAAVHDGEFRRFVVSAGPVPDVEQVLLPATQTYSDGTVVTWDEETPASGEEPAHPAPLLRVSAGSGGGHGAAPADGDASGEESAGAADDRPGLAAALGAAGLGLGLVGAVTGVVALARSGRDGSGRRTPAGHDGAEGDR